jgi:cytochrome c oxidase assembly factor CtaG
MTRSALIRIAVVVAVWPGALYAHGAAADERVWWRVWAWDPATVASLFFMAAIYVAGLRALRKATQTPQKLQGAARCYAAGWGLLVVALISPMHPWGQVFFSVHMVQHEVLMVLAAPLLVLGRPVLVVLSAGPRPAARRCVTLLRQNGGTWLWDAVTNPLVAWLAHAIALWVWHVPTLFQATLKHEGIHAMQHASFLGSALIFWHAVIFGPRRRLGYGMGLVYLFTTAIHSGALGALLTFATRLWYPAYAAVAHGGSLTPLEDQQLGGLIMWIPAGLIYLGAGLALFALWIRQPRSSAAPPRIPASCVSSS